MTSFPIPTASCTFKEEIKKSRFITHLAHTPGVKAAQAFVQQVKGEHTSARHNCWAFFAGSPTDSMQLGFSDDGEPTGTAGKPILAQLQGSGVGEICAVVTRYSGGIKLGTGGLVSAYGGGVSQALAILQTELKIAKSIVSLQFNYTEQKLIEHLVMQLNGKIIEANYTSDIKLSVELEQTKESEFKQKLVAQGRGRIQIFENNWKT